MNTLTQIQTRADAEDADRRDPLACKRAAFALPADTTYLVGHSLGPATHSALERLQQTAQQDWAVGLVRSWNTADWINLAARVGQRIGRLIGAPAGDVIICDSVSVNLFKLAIAAQQLCPNGNRIIVEADEFPTDQYIAESASDLTDATLVRVPAGKGVDAITERGGVLIKSLVNYRTAEIADMAAIEKAAAANGSIIIWDLSHATGVINIDVQAAGARIATGCTYKYLNGGPGAPAFLYASSDLAQRMRTPLPGWMGHAAPFDFAGDYSPRDGAARFAAGTPGILSLCALDGALDIFDATDMSDIETKARALGTLCLQRADTLGVSTRPPAHRGGHISLFHTNGYPIVQALAEHGILADFRTPDTIRFGLSPLFLTYTEVWDVMDTLGEIIETEQWKHERFQTRAEVT